MGRATRSLPLWLLVGGIGCKGAASLALRDTEGRQFEASCDKTAGCSVRQSGGASESDAFVLRAEGRLFGVCPKTPGAEGGSPADCRPLTCDKDDACPPPQGLERGQCVNGLCTEPSRPIGVADAVMLCLAGTGTGHGSARQAERFAMALNCGDPCRIPSPCRQP